VCATSNISRWRTSAATAASENVHRNLEKVWDNRLKDRRAPPNLMEVNLAGDDYFDCKNINLLPVETA